MPSPKSATTKQEVAAAPLARPGTKLAKILELMTRPQGATVDELASATGWQKHTVRGAIAGAIKKKRRQRVKLVEQGDRRAYSIGKAPALKVAK